MRNKKNILWLSHFVPYPPVGGAYQRSYNLLREISRSNNIYLLAVRHKKITHPGDDFEMAKSELLSFCKDVEIVDISSRTYGVGLYKSMLRALLYMTPFSVEILKSSEYSQLIKEFMEKVDFNIIHYDTLGLAEFFDDSNDIPKILNHHDVESHKMRSMIVYESNIIKKFIYFLEAFKLKRYEKKHCNKFALNILVSEHDRNRLKNVAPALRTEIVDNGVDVQYFRRQFNLSNNNVLIFAGRLDQFANKDGVLFFCKKIWPLLKREQKKLRFIIIGNNPPNELIRLAKNDRMIEIKGYVDDVRPYFKKAAVFICPMRTKGGTRVKILDALSMGMPIVSSRIGCDGLDLEPEKDIMIADTPEAFVEKIINVLNNSSLRKILSENAREKAESQYSWGIIGEKFRMICSDLDKVIM